MCTAAIATPTLCDTIRDHSCCRPSYCSYKSLEKTYNLEFWLQYWTVFGLLSVLEYLLFFLVRLVPLFSLFKLAFLIWLQTPQTQVRHSSECAFFSHVGKRALCMNSSFDEHLQLACSCLHTG